MGATSLPPSDIRRSFWRDLERKRPPQIPCTFSSRYRLILAGLICHAHDARGELADHLNQLVLCGDDGLDVLVRLWRLVNGPTQQFHVALTQVGIARALADAIKRRPT